ncbi:hypothetical protein EDB19DRAFT_1920080 [Suillus lakei]|nr:hypothetical protein EDB19DRAFT_1920080 [Suillus lakei]
MPPKKKNTTKKSAGGTADRVSGPLGSPVRNGEEVLPTVSAEPELPAETHSLWCLICRDGADGDVILYQCDSCPHIMCSHCINVPAGHLDAVRHINVVFVCLSCHSERTCRNPAPYFGFYSTNLPEKGGHPVLPDFLQLRGKFKTASCSLLASTPVAIIHFIVGANDEVITPVPILSRYLEHCYPNGGYTYLEVVFDVATHQKINDYNHLQDARVAHLKRHLGPAGRIFAFFSNHSEQDSGWLFAGKVKGKFIAMSVSQVLSTVFAPYISLLKAANIVFLVCGSIVTYEDSFVELKQAILDLKVASAIVFPATRFQPLVATNFLLAMAELVIVEQLNLQKTFPTLLSLSNRLGLHTNVIVMTTVDDAVQLSVTMFARAHPQTKPWGINVPAQCPLCGSTSSWSEKDDFVAALPDTRGKILKIVCDEIVTMHDSLEDPVVLPKRLKKAIRRYYLQFLTDKEDIRAEEQILGDEQDQEPCGVSPEQREVAARPKDAGFYKKELTDWDVAQKLFKVEMDDYDKEEQSKLGVKRSIKFRTGHARDWFNDMSRAERKEVEDMKDKWNKEGAPAESQAMYRKRNLKKVLDDFTEQIHRTMGCRIVMLVSHKKKSDQTLSVAVHESKPLNSNKPFTQSSRGCKEWTSDGFEKFAEWSKLEFYPEDEEDKSDEEDEDNDTKEKLPELVLDNKGYAKLPSRAGIHTRGQQELVRRIFHASYKVFTKSSKPVPWREVIANPSLQAWQYEQRKPEECGSLSGEPKKKDYKEIDDKDKDPTSGKISTAHTDRPAESKAASKSSASTRPTPHTTRPAESKAASKASASTHPTPRITGPAEGDSSDEESAAVTFARRTAGPATRPSGAQDGAPAVIPMKDRVHFLKSLSSHNGYLLLVEGIRDLEKESNSDQQKGWPTWATWSWEGSYLPDSVHSEDGTVLKFLETATSAKITSLASGMRVTLGLGLLLRECKRAIEYEADEPPQNTPTYIGTSTLGIKILVLVEEAVDTVRGGILRLVKGWEGQQKHDMIVGTANGDGAAHSTHSSAVGEKRTTEEVERSEVEERQKDQERSELEDEQLTEEDLQKLEEAKQTGETLKEDIHTEAPGGEAEAGGGEASPFSEFTRMRRTAKGDNVPIQMGQPMWAHGNNCTMIDEWAEGGVYLMQPGGPRVVCT